MNKHQTNLMSHSICESLVDPVQQAMQLSHWGSYTYNGEQTHKIRTICEAGSASLTRGQTMSAIYTAERTYPGDCVHKTVRTTEMKVWNWNKTEINLKQKTVSKLLQNCYVLAKQNAPAVKHFTHRASTHSPQPLISNCTQIPLSSRALWWLVFVSLLVSNVAITPLAAEAAVESHFDSAWKQIPAVAPTYLLCTPLSSTREGAIAHRNPSLVVVCHS